MALCAGLGSRRCVWHSCPDVWLLLEPRCTLGSDLCQRSVAVHGNYGPAATVHYASLISDYFKHWVVPVHGINWTLGMAAVLVIPFLFVAAIPVLELCLGFKHGIRNIGTEITLYWLAGSAFWLSEIHRKDISTLLLDPRCWLSCVSFICRSAGTRASV